MPLKFHFNCFEVKQFSTKIWWVAIAKIETNIRNFNFPTLNQTEKKGCYTIDSRSLLKKKKVNRIKSLERHKQKRHSD